MSDTDLGNVFYSIVAKDTTSGGTASAAQNFFFMFNAIQEGVSLVQGAFDDTVGAAFNFTQEIKQVSDVTGMTTDQTQKWGAAAVASGSSLDVMSSGLSYVVGLLGQNTTAGDNYRAKLDEMGIAYKDQNGHLLDADQLQKNILASLNAVTDGDKRGADAKEIYGMRWKTQMEMVNNAKAALDTYNSTTPPFNESQMAEMDKARIQWGQMNYQIGIMQDKIGAELVPVLINMLSIMNTAFADGAPILQFFGDVGEVIEDVIEAGTRAMGMLEGAAAAGKDIASGNLGQAYTDFVGDTNKGDMASATLRYNYSQAQKAMAPGASPSSSGSSSSSVDVSDLGQSKTDKLTAQQTTEGNAISNDQAQDKIDQAKLTHAENTDKNTAGILLELQKLNQKLASDSANYNTTTSTLTQLSRQQGVPLQ